jgi:hypothetical protein
LLFQSSRENSSDLLDENLGPGDRFLSHIYDNACNLLAEDNPLGQTYYVYTYNRPLHKHYNHMTGNTSDKYNFSLYDELNRFGLGSNKVFTAAGEKGSKPYMPGTKCL